MSEIIIEKLLEQRNFYLNTLKHLDFQALENISEKESRDIVKLQTSTIDQLKKIEQEITYILSKESS